MRKNISKYFLDSNILIRFLKQDGSLKQQQESKKIIAKLEKQEIVAVINSLVLHETTYILTRLYKINRQQVVDSIKKIISLPNLQILNFKKSELTKILNLFAQYNVDFADCLFAYLSQKLKLQLLSFDQDFAKLGVEIKQKA